MKLILFDIDGTLVSGGSAAKIAFEAAMLDVYGTAGPIESHDFSGKTDPLIARELLELADFEPARIDSGLPRLWDRYLDGLEHGLRSDPVTVLPGVNRLLDALRLRTDARMGLVTGNLERGAYLKLGSVGLGERFRIGAFGSDHAERNHLPRLAVERARETWGVHFDPEAVVIVGDTPRDVECGKHLGGRTVAVATGRWAEDQLAATGADEVIGDFSDLQRTLEALLN